MGDLVNLDSLKEVIEFIYSGEINLEDNKKDDLVAEAMKKLQIELNIVREETFLGAVDPATVETREGMYNNNEGVFSHGNLQTHLEDPCGLISKDLNSRDDNISLFKQEPSKSLSA